MSPATKVFAWTLAGLAAIGIAAAIGWQIQTAQTSVYTDGDRIAVRASAAPLRSILWQPSAEVPGGLNTTADEYEPRISADGARMIFVRGKPGANADLFECRWTPDGWSAPAPIASVNTASDELGPELSRDGQSLYFYSDRAGGQGGFDLWFARAEGAGWKPPENLGPAINSEQNEYGPALTPDGGTLYFSSNRPRAAEPPRQRDAWPATVRESRDRHDYDLYTVSLAPNNPLKPVSVSGLNTPFDEGSPCLSPAGDFLYFASDRPGGFGGFDLYRARLARGTPGTPELLDAAVNSPANDLDPALSMDGFRLCFSSSRPSNILPPRDAPEAAADYGLWTTSSREVYLQSDAAAARAALLGLLRDIAPWLLLLLPLGVLFFALRDPRFRRGFGKLSLLAQCVLISLMIHAIIASLLAVWKVGSQIGEFLSDGGGSRVILASSGIAGGVELQVRGDLTEPLDSIVDVPQSRADLMPALMRMQTVSLDAPQSDRHDQAAPLPAAAPTIEPASDRSAPAPAAAPPAPSVADARTPADIAAATAVEEAAVRAPSPSPQTSSAPALTATPLNATRIAIAPPARDAAASDGAATIEPTRSTSPSTLPQSAASTLPTSASPQAAARTPTSSAPEAMVNEGESVTPVRTGSESPAGLAAAHGISAATAQIAPATEGAPSEDRAAAIPAPLGGNSPSPSASVPAPTTAAPASPSTIGNHTALPTVATSTNAASENPVPTASTGMAMSQSRAAVQSSGSPLASRVNVPVTAPSGGSPDSAAAVPAATVQATAGPSASRPSSAVTPSPGLAAAPSVALPRIAATSTAGGAEAASPGPLPQISEIPRAALAGGASSPKPALASRVDLAPAPSTPARGDDARLPAAHPGTSGHASRAPTIASAAAPPAFAPASGDTARLPATEPEPKPLDTFAQRAPESRGELLKRMGGSEDTERAVGLALDWLSTRQSADGRWSGRRFDEGHEPAGGAAEIDSDAAMTGLSLLCFLGAGHTHTTDGPYRANVQRSLDWLLARQAANGDLRRDLAVPEAPGETMYSHNVATVALCEAFSMTRDPKIASAARRAIAFMISIQANPDPSRRTTRARAEDTSVIGWQVMAMHSARRSGFSVPQSAFNAAASWLDSVASPSQPGRYAYGPSEQPSPAMTAEAMFIQQLLGHASAEPRMGQSARFILATPPRWEAGAPTHYWYYATLALFQHQGEEWRTWNDELVPQLLGHQHQTGPAKGTWDPKDEWSRLGGRIYQTAICTLSLEVYYRYKAPPPKP